MIRRASMSCSAWACSIARSTRYSASSAFNQGKPSSSGIRWEPANGIATSGRGTASGYTKRSKVETTVHRYKTILGPAMRARGLASQRVDARIGCKLLNTMTALGVPESEMLG